MLAIDTCFKALAKHAELVVPVLALLDRGAMVGPMHLKVIASSSGISSAKLPQLRDALLAGASMGVFKETSLGGWVATCSSEDATKLRLMLHGLNLYLSKVHKKADEVTVVISKPALPSQLVDILEKSLEGFSGMQTTAHALIGLAERARNRLTIMTPFIDESGVERILELYSTAGSAVRKELVVRQPFSEALSSSLKDLQLLGVKVFDFRISKDDSHKNETFHAKVVAIDSNECYVGSSNMTEWSFNYSLEIGLLVRGEAARRVSQILDSIVNISELEVYRR